MKRLLLHACCAPCLSSPLLMLSGRMEAERAINQKEEWDISIFFYNPNLDSVAEWERRYEAVQGLVRDLGSEGIKANLLETTADEDREAWKKAVEGNELEPERGNRCSICYAFRLRKTLETAKEKGFDKVATSLTLSPHKNTPRINQLGDELSRSFGVEYLMSDFKKNDGYKKSIELSARYGLYRQSYCGCEFSKERSKSFIAANEPRGNR